MHITVTCPINEPRCISIIHSSPSLTCTHTYTHTRSDSRGIHICGWLANKGGKIKTGLGEIYPCMETRRGGHTHTHTTRREGCSQWLLYVCLLAPFVAMLLHPPFLLSNIHISSCQFDSFYYSSTHTLTLSLHTRTHTHTGAEKRLSPPNLLPRHSTGKTPRHSHTDPEYLYIN